MEAKISCETTVRNYKSTRRHIPEHCNRHHQYENLKSHNLKVDVPEHTLNRNMLGCFGAETSRHDSSIRRSTIPLVQHR